MPASTASSAHAAATHAAASHPTGADRNRPAAELVALDGDLDPSRYAHLVPARAGTPPTLAQLVHLAREVTANREEWRHLVRFDPWRRWRHRLRAENGYEVWLMSWLPGQRTGQHEHGDSTAVIAVASGQLWEHITTEPAENPVVQVIGTDRVRIWGARRLREIANLGADPAISVHVYSPALP